MSGKILHNTDWWSFFSLKGLIWMYCWNLKRVTFCNVGFDYDVNDPICDWHPTIPYLVRSQKMAETILNSESSDSPGDILNCCLARLFIWKSKPYIKQAKTTKKLLRKSEFPVDPFPPKLVDGVGMCVWMEQVIWAIIVRSLPSSGVEPARCGGSALCPWSALPPGSSTDQATTPQCVESCSTRDN